MRRMVLILLILDGLFLPLSALPALFLFNAVNPLQLAFITDFTVENRTDAPIFVTPIGTVGPEGRRAPLPLTRWKSPWLPASRYGRFPIPSGQAITLHYDWDDINFSELVVEDSKGTLRQLVVNPDPTANQYIRPPSDHFVIGDDAPLGPVDPRVRDAYHLTVRPVNVVGGWLLLAGMTAPLVVFLLLLRWYRRLASPGRARREDPAGSSVPRAEDLGNQH